MVRQYSQTVHRWYEGHEELIQLVKGLKTLPSEYQDLFAKTIIEVVKDIRQEEQFSRKLRELGSQKVQGLLKSKQKLRWYDRNPMMHKAFNDVYVLEQTQQILVAAEINKAIFYVEEYIAQCRAHDKAPSTSEGYRLIREVIVGGDDAGEAFLKDEFCQY